MEFVRKTPGENTLRFDASRSLSVVQRENIAYDVTNTVRDIESLCCLPNKEAISGKYYNTSSDTELTFSLKRRPVVDTRISGKLSLREGDFRRSVSRDSYLPTWSGLKDNSDIIAMLACIDTVNTSRFCDMTDISDSDMWTILSTIPAIVKTHEKEYSFDTLTALDGLDMISQLAVASLYAKSPKSRNFYNTYGHRRTHENFYSVKIQRILQEESRPNSTKESIEARVNKQSGEVDLTLSISSAQSNEQFIRTDPEELVFQVTEACKLLLKTIPVENDPLARP